MPKVAPIDIARAYEHVARVNHYLVGVCADDATREDVEAAEQILISRQNNMMMINSRSLGFRLAERALDLIQLDLQQDLVRDSRGQKMRYPYAEREAV